MSTSKHNTGTKGGTGDVQLMKISGRLTASENLGVLTEMQARLDQSNKLVIDCSELEYVDSSGLGVLLTGLKKALKSQGDIRLVQPQPKVKIMFQVTRADKVFKIFPTAEEAMESFAVTHPNDNSNL